MIEMYFPIILNSDAVICVYWSHSLVCLDYFYVMFPTLEGDGEKCFSQDHLKAVLHVTFFNNQWLQPALKIKYPRYSENDSVKDSFT